MNCRKRFYRLQRLKNRASGGKNRTENRSIFDYRFFEDGENLWEVLRRSGFAINGFCGGQGSCGKCKVIIAPPPPPNIQEDKLLAKKELARGVRLACTQEVAEDIEIVLEPESKIEALTEGADEKINLAPQVNSVCISLGEFELEDQRDLLTRIYEEVPVEKIEAAALEELSLAANSENEEVQIIYSSGEILKVKPVGKKEAIYGLAVDIGTTTLAFYLINLTTGEEKAVASLPNPQSEFGADVISRINYTQEKEQGRKEMQQKLVFGLNQGIKKLISKAKIKKENIMWSTVVGNTVMLHTLLGADAGSIARAPYIPTFTGDLSLTPEKIGLKVNSRGRVEFLPSISGYVGADIVADMLTVDFASSEEWNLLIDIGTNGEIVLGNQDEILACSTAAGPALEGANITYGVAGVPGAVSEYEIKENGKINYQVIGNQPPQGICGSGLIDIIAQLYKWGFLSKNAGFKDDELLAWQKKRLTNYENLAAYEVLTKKRGESNKDILLTQKDIREVQLAKGSIAAGIEILLTKAGIDYEQINNVYLAGGFGSQIKTSSAAAIGLISPQLEEKIVKIGNGAGIGAKWSLLNQELSQTAKKIAAQVEYIELSTHSDFQTIFIQEMEF